jgi:nucleotide-binding universal stress UspA family protein
MRILIGVDGSATARVACELVASRTWPADARVTLLGAVEPVVDWTGLAPARGESIAADVAGLERVLEDQAASLGRCGLAAEISVEMGRAAELLALRAAELPADLIVVGNRGLGPAGSALLGSVSAHLVDHAGCPVLVARSPEMTRMLVATDGTTSSRDVPHVLASWGNAFRGLSVEVLSVASADRFFSPIGDEELALHERFAEQVAEELMELGWNTAATARVGDPSQQIVSESREWRADLIVTGSRGVGTLRRIIGGSVAHDVLLHARSSVLVVRGHVTAPEKAFATGSVFATPA